jgi:hypothetical protein
VVENSSHQPNVKGYSPAADAGIRRDEIAKSYVNARVVAQWWDTLLIILTVRV